MSDLSIQKCKEVLREIEIESKPGLAQTIQAAICEMIIDICEESDEFTQAIMQADTVSDFYNALSTWLNGERWEDELPSNDRGGPEGPQRIGPGEGYRYV